MPLKALCSGAVTYMSAAFMMRRERYSLVQTFEAVGSQKLFEGRVQHRGILRIRLGARPVRDLNCGGHLSWVLWDRFWVSCILSWPKGLYKWEPGQERIDLTVTVAPSDGSARSRCFIYGI